MHCGVTVASLARDKTLLKDYRILFTGGSGYVNTNTGKSCFFFMTDQMRGAWQSPKEPLHRVEYGTSSDRLLASLRELIDDVRKEDKIGVSGSIRKSRSRRLGAAHRRMPFRRQPMHSDPIRRAARGTNACHTQSLERQHQGRFPHGPCSALWAAPRRPP